MFHQMSYNELFEDKSNDTSPHPTAGGQQPTSTHGRNDTTREYDMVNRKAAEVLNEEFLAIRAGLLRVAAALDRIDRVEGQPDADRLGQIKQGIQVLAEDSPGRAERFQMVFSLPCDEQ
jgi:hypothetical protein